MNEADVQRLRDRIGNLERETAEQGSRLARAERRIVAVGGWVVNLSAIVAMIALTAMAVYRKNDFWDWLAIGMFAIVALVIIRDMIKRFDKDRL